MNKLVAFLLAFAAAGTISCFANEVKYDIMGPGAPEDGEPVKVDVAEGTLSDQQPSLVGQKFLDLEEPDKDGVMHKLSEYVGKGNWILVDFWASWCGPCKAEMPNVVAAYKKYHSKGFDIVGLSFDREKAPWIRAIREWDMPWIHLSDIKYWNSKAREVYGVDAIPDNLLIDPQGIIVARGLRGNALEAKLAEIFK